jgi:hypothetical protein
MFEKYFSALVPAQAAYVGFQGKSGQSTDVPLCQRMADSVDKVGAEWVGCLFGRLPAIFVSLSRYFCFFWGGLAPDVIEAHNG